MMTAKPTFINIGPGRCATSWLFEVLKAHPQITMANVKETEYFNTNYENGHGWYESHFPAENRAAVGEISNNYYLDPMAATRIREYNPDMRIMINVRDPFALMESFHGFGLRRGLDIGGLENNIDTHIGKLMGSGYAHRKKNGTLKTGDTFTLVESVLLSQRLKPFFETFPQEQIYVFVFERLKSEGDQVLKEIYDFLGIDSGFTPAIADKVVNASIVPKSKIVARLAPKITYLLRRAGMYGLLSTLHRSELIKRLLYKETQKVVKEKVDPRDRLDKESRFVLDEEIVAMKKMLPQLKMWWQHRELPDRSFPANDFASTK